MGVKTHLILFNLRIYTAEEKLGVMDKFFFFLLRRKVSVWPSFLLKTVNPTGNSSLSLTVMMIELSIKGL